MKDHARPSFTATCACGVEVIRHAKNGKPFKCFDCKRKDRQETTKVWYRKPGNKERRLQYDKDRRPTRYATPDS